MGVHKYIDDAFNKFDEGYNELWEAFKKLNERVDELEDINGVHQTVVEALKTDKAELIRELTKCQAERQRAINDLNEKCLCCDMARQDPEPYVAGETVGPYYHWMHYTGPK